MRGFTILWAVVIGPVVHAGLDCDSVVDEYGPSRIIDSAECVQVQDDGGMNSLSLYEGSWANILGTSPLREGSGGIWELRQYGNSRLDMSGGEINMYEISSDAMATVSGGSIGSMYSQQYAWVFQGDPPEPVWNPHITMICDLDSVFHNIETNLLTGKWLDGSAFSIQLVDVNGYDPTIENIQFVPEPTTLFLLGLGGLLLRKRAS